MNTNLQIETRIKGKTPQARVKKFTGIGLVPSSYWFNEEEIRGERGGSQIYTLRPYVKQVLLEALRQEAVRNNLSTRRLKALQEAQASLLKRQGSMERSEQRLLRKLDKRIALLVPAA